METTLDIALPCATQNEIEAADAEALVKAGVKLVAEGANMPSTSEAIDIYHSNGIVFGPAKVLHRPLPSKPVFSVSKSKLGFRLRITSPLFSPPARWNLFANHPAASVRCRPLLLLCLYLRLSLFSRACLTPMFRLVVDSPDLGIVIFELQIAGKG